MEVNALSKPYSGIVDCIKTPVKVADPYSGKELTTLAIWDTGATNTVITKTAAEALELTPIGRAMVKGVHDVREVNVYAVRVTLNNESISMITQVSECDELSSSGDTGVLIGMNIISKGDFAISNFEGNTLMTFRVPSIAKTDYVEDLKILDYCTKMHKNNILHHRPDKCACGSGKLFKNCHGKNLIK